MGSETEPSVLVIRALEACNAGCFMCGFAFSNDSYRFTRDDLSEVLARIRGGAIKLIRFTGGEPLLIPEMPDILADIKRAGILTSIITNGWHLPTKASGLSGGILDQVIISLDAPVARSHDKFRRLDGLFDRIVEGIAQVKLSTPDTLLRVNSVVGSHNLRMLTDMWRLLCQLGVQQWSMIPLKRDEGAWGHLTLEQIEAQMDDFVSTIARDRAGDPDHGPRILGYGLDLFGRNREERERLWASNRNIVPLGKCNLVDKVRYFVPKQGFVFPCNCVPHRTGGQEHSGAVEANSFTSEGIVAQRDWLRANGPTTCTGCEPVNAALGDLAIDLDRDPFGY